jgi:hypothetical protein
MDLYEHNLGKVKKLLGAGAIKCQMGRGAGAPVNRFIGSAPGPPHKPSSRHTLKRGPTIVKAPPAGWRAPRSSILAPLGGVARLRRATLDTPLSETRADHSAGRSAFKWEASRGGLLQAMLGSVVPAGQPSYTQLRRIRAPSTDGAAPVAPQ